MPIKKLTILFGASTVGIVICLIMTIVTGVHEYKEKNTPTPITLPAPAMNQ